MYSLHFETSVRVEPPTDTDMVPFFIVACNKRVRYDTLEFDDDENPFKQVLAIISFRKTSVIGRYASYKPKVRIEYLDTFLICADFEHVPSIANY